MMLPTKAYFLKCTNSSFRLILKKIKKWAEDLNDISPKKTYRWPTGTRKDAQYH